jgi:hypothetical protein
MINRDHPILRAAVVTAVGVCTLSMTSVPAYAKSDIYFVAAPHNVHLGRHIHLTGNAVDDNATFNRFCIQQRSGHAGWRSIKCTPGSYNGGGGLNLWLRPRHRGLVLFRGVLFEGASPKDRHPGVHLVSRAFALAVS